MSVFSTSPPRRKSPVLACGLPCPSLFRLRLVVGALAVLAVLVVGGARPAAAEHGAGAAATGVVVSTETLALDEGGSGAFTVALADDPGSSVTVALVKAPYVVDPVTGAVRYGFDRTAVGVSPAALVFTSGDYDTPQTVTVTSAHDDDSHDEQVIILIMAQTAAASGDTAAVYEPVGDSANAITGVVVTIDDDESPSGT